MTFAKVIGMDIHEGQAKEKRKRTNEFNPSRRPETRKEKRREIRESHCRRKVKAKNNPII